MYSSNLFLLEEGKKESKDKFTYNWVDYYMKTINIYLFFSIIHINYVS